MSFSRRWKLFVIYAIVALVLNAEASEAGLRAHPSDQQIAQWIKELGDNDFAVREKASRQLWLAGEAAEAALEKAVHSGDSEVVRRSRDILEKFRWGIYPDTPAAIVALIQTYQSSQAETVRRQTLEKLLRDDPAGLRAVLRLADMEKDAAPRKALQEQVSRKLLAAYQRFRSADGDPERFDSFINFAYDRSCIPNNHFVAYWLLRGKLDEQIAHFRRRLSAHRGERRFSETLAHLQRAKGDWREARAAAELAKQEGLVRDLLIEAGEWKTLAAHPQRIDNKSPDEKWAFRATCARLAGKSEDFEVAVRELLRLAENDRHAFSGWRSIAHLLLLNDRPDEALALFAKSPDHQTELFELLCARRHYHEALALADKPRPADSNEQQYLDLLKARTLYQLGEQDKARALFVQYGGRIKEGVKGFWAQRLIAEEYKVGLKDLAFEHCGRIKSVEVNWGKVSPGWGQSVFLDQVFPARSKTARIWWDLLGQKFSEDSPAATLRRLRDLLDGKMEAQKVKQWIEEVEQGKMRARLEPGKAPASHPPLNTGDLHWLALADAAHANGLEELAASLLEKAGTSEALIRLGDMLADKEQWTRAADYYGRAWRMSIEKEVPFIEEEHGDPLPLYLAGLARRKMGERATGDKLIEQSHRALLGEVRGRYAFLEALEERGYVQDARREVDLLSRLSEPNSFYSGAALRRLGRAAANRKDYERAADCYQQSTLRFFRSTAFYNEIGSYLAVPALVHRLRASHLLRAGKYEEARRHIDLALSLNPGDENIAITLVPELERCDRKKEAVVLFDRCLEPHEKTCRDHPRCALSHNAAAWLSACCRRNLDQALQHAEKAVDLAPTHAGYLDTLAEVHFQRGDKDKAVALQKRVIELNPKKSYYRKQLKRLESGDPTTDRPPENDE